MKTFNHRQGGAYASPDIEVQLLDVECGFATSTKGKWEDASSSSPDFAGLDSYYDGEFE